MFRADRYLNNLLHLLSPAQPVHTITAIRTDGIIVTPIGCFRIAYSSEHHSVVLFFARHPDDLAGTACNDGTLDISFKNRVFPIRGYKVHHDVDIRWNRKDKRQQLDLSWMRRDIAHVVHDLPRILLREANLHQLSDTFLTSAFVGYKIRPVDDTHVRVEIITKTTDNYALVPDPDNANGHTSAIGRAGHALTSRTIHKPIALTQIIGGSATTHLFEKARVVRAIEADFKKKIELIWEGKDPIRWKSHPLVPAMRVADSLRHSLKHMRSINTHSVEHTARHVVSYAIQLAVFGLKDVFETVVIETVMKTGARQNHGVMPEDLSDIIKSDRRLKSIDSRLHAVLHSPVPENFGDLKWVNTQNHLPNHMIREANKHDHKTQFKNWFASMFYGSYVSSIENLVAEDKTFDVMTPNNIELVRFNIQNGMILYYDCETHMLYGHFHQPDYNTGHHQLPHEAKDHLFGDQVLALCLKEYPDCEMQQIPFEKFTNMVREKLKSLDIALPRAQAPAEEYIKPSIEFRQMLREQEARTNLLEVDAPGHHL